MWLALTRRRRRHGRRRRVRGLLRDLHVAGNAGREARRRHGRAPLAGARRGQPRCSLRSVARCVRVASRGSTRPAIATMRTRGASTSGWGFARSTRSGSRSCSADGRAAHRVDSGRRRRPALRWQRCRSSTRTSAAGRSSLRTIERLRDALEPRRDGRGSGARRHVLSCSRRRAARRRNPALRRRDPRRNRGQCAGRPRGALRRRRLDTGARCRAPVRPDRRVAAAGQRARGRCRRRPARDPRCRHAEARGPAAARARAAHRGSRRALAGADAADVPLRRPALRARAPGRARRHRRGARRSRRLAITGACTSPWLVTGSSLNIKVTFPSDLALAAAILALQDERR